MPFLSLIRKCSHPSLPLCLLPNEAGGLCQISIFSTSSVEWSGPCQPWICQVTHTSDWDVMMMGNIVCISRDNCYNVTVLGWVLENVGRIVGASVGPRAWRCLRGKNWYFIEFSRLGTWIFAHKTKCWCQIKNCMSLYILIFISNYILHIPQKYFCLKAQSWLIKINQWLAYSLCSCRLFQ